MNIESRAQKAQNPLNPFAQNPVLTQNPVKQNPFDL